MRLISWNVNGIRAAIKKDFVDWFLKEDADVVCLQEVKAEEDQVELDFAREAGYQVYWNHATKKKGYSGTAILCKQEPEEVRIEMDSCTHDGEGRVIAARFKDFWVVNAYVPNSQNELRRLPYRQRWDKHFRKYLRAREKESPVLVCGDFNVAHEEIDLARPKANRKSAGFTDEERAGFSGHLKAGFVDTFRHFEDGPEHYSWWSYRAGARSRNIGWRIDYWLASEKLMDRVVGAHILSEVMGSDHCPVEVSLK